jgi:hypothetical protein
MDSKSKKKMERPATHKEELEEKAIRKLSLSSSKIVSKLSLSFYDESTLRKSKQIILDDCLLDNEQRFTVSQTLASSKQKLKSASKKKKKEVREEWQPFKDREEVDFTTTASKINSSEWEEKTKPKTGKAKGKRSSSKEKASSIDKFRKQLLADILQSRSKIPKTLHERR